jgi:hypothetical protein
MLAVKPVVVILVLDGVNGCSRVVPRLLVAVLQERLEVRNGVSLERVCQDGARLHPGHITRVVEGGLRQLHDLGIFTRESHEPEQDRVPPRGIPNSRVGCDETGNQPFQPVFLEQSLSAAPRSVCRF